MQALRGAWVCANRARCHGGLPKISLQRRETPIGGTLWRSLLHRSPTASYFPRSSGLNTNLQSHSDCVLVPSLATPVPVPSGQAFSVAGGNAAGDPGQIRPISVEVGTRLLAISLRSPSRAKRDGEAVGSWPLPPCMGAHVKVSCAYAFSVPSVSSPWRAEASSSSPRSKIISSPNAGT